MIFLRKPNQPRRVLGLVSTSLLLSVSACADRPIYNDKKIPGVEDLMQIEKSLKANLAKARAATVCIQIGQGSGSGVIISEDGLILSAAHVSTGVGKEMKIVMEDGTEYNVISLGLDSETDASMLQITDEGKYPFVEFEPGKTQNESTTKLGDWVFSLGHSGGYDKDRGSVVRLGRIVRIADRTIQSDCKLIGGDSGGPLFDMNGMLVGIHSRVGKVLDVNMHVPLHVYHGNWERLKNNEFIGEGPFAQRPVPGSGFIGVAVEEVDTGLKIVDVDETAAGGKAGLKQGDVIISIDGKEMEKTKDLSGLMKKKAEGEKLVIVVLRDDEEQTFTIKLGVK